MINAPLGNRHTVYPGTIQRGDFACGLTVLLQSRRASNRFDRLLTASFVAVVVLVWLKLLCSTVIDFARAVRISGSPVAVETYVPQTDW